MHGPRFANPGEAPIKGLEYYLTLARQNPYLFSDKWKLVIGVTTSPSFFTEKPNQSKVNEIRDLKFRLPFMEQPSYGIHGSFMGGRMGYKHDISIFNGTNVAYDVFQLLTVRKNLHALFLFIMLHFCYAVYWFKVFVEINYVVLGGEEFRKL